MDHNSAVSRRYVRGFVTREHYPAARHRLGAPLSLGVLEQIRPNIDPEPSERVCRKFITGLLHTPR